MTAMNRPEVAWTTPVDVRERLRKRWNRGTHLTARARGELFAPVDVPIRGPRVGELGEHFDAVARWVEQWRVTADSPHLDVRFTTTGGRKFGVTKLPTRVMIADFDAFTRYLGTTDQARRHSTMLDAAGERIALREWLITRPIRALTHYDDFDRLLIALDWLVENAGSGRRLREIDAPGVDTKFIENHRTILMELGGLMIDRDLVNSAETSIAGRFGFATDTARVRFRLLDPECESPTPGFDDVEVRVSDLDAHPLDVDHVLIVENLATYLSCPQTPRSAVIFGGGYGASVVGALTWLRSTDVAYWGDLDTHGFAILDRVRVTVPHARSILMDRATLLAHRTRWGTEPAQVDRPLPRLTDDEAALYRDLVEDVLGPSIRLEQERIPLPSGW
ncbi:hypothetical protein CJJ17_23615 [Gordonia polyisoprenivorans]|nr:hypothetical protein CJJ17_23615 [Gordonia polyisoprenivorans]